jgi:hypothetical protein
LSRKVNYDEINRGGDAAAEMMAADDVGGTGSAPRRQGRVNAGGKKK